MHTDVCDRLGIEFPILALSHCRDVVAAVSKAGGMGVLGAVGFNAEQLEVELKWIDEHVGDKPYGVDIVITGKHEGMHELDKEKLEGMLRAEIPAEHREFAGKILADHGVPELPADEPRHQELLGWTHATAALQIETSLRHNKVRLIASALGTLPRDVIQQIHGSGPLVAALCGSTKHALDHKEAGVDILIAQGSEGGGHTGEIGSVVLWPDVIDAVAPTPVLAAGGIASGRAIAAALAMGAQGVWTGLMWLTVEETDVPTAQMESYLAAANGDTVRSRAWTGKPCRMLRNAWTDAWEDPSAPDPLGMPHQLMVTMAAVQRGRRYPEQAKRVNFNPVGQVVGQMNTVSPVKQVMYRLVQEYFEAAQRLASLMPAD